MWGDGDKRIRPGSIGIEALRAVDVAATVAWMGYECESLRLLIDFERDAVLRDLFVELRLKLQYELLALRADPCGVLGRTRTRGKGGAQSTEG